MITGVLTGFFVSFVGVLLTTPTEGKEVRTKITDQVQTIKTFPQDAKERMKKKEEKAYRVGKEKYESIMKDMEDIKYQARLFAREEANE